MASATMYCNVCVYRVYVRLSDPNAQELPLERVYTPYTPYIDRNLVSRKLVYVEAFIISSHLPFKLDLPMAI